MRRALNIAMPLIMLGIFILAIWYTAFRLHIHFDTVSFWIYQTIVAAVVIGTFALVGMYGVTVYKHFTGVCSKVICIYLIHFVIDKIPFRFRNENTQQ
ncbi:MAG: hypothetical protein FWB93_00480 [Oscillospiraceae bacterium]|nr:hypothetical protein [Oscillospiraceae bacterium]